MIFGKIKRSSFHTNFCYCFYEAKLLKYEAELKELKIIEESEKSFKYFSQNDLDIIGVNKDDTVNMALISSLFIALGAFIALSVSIVIPKFFSVYNLYEGEDVLSCADRATKCITSGGVVKSCLFECTKAHSVAEIQECFEKVKT